MSIFRFLTGSRQHKQKQKSELCGYANISKLANFYSRREFARSSLGDFCIWYLYAYVFLLFWMYIVHGF